MPNQTGQKNQNLITGRIAYGYDGTDAYPIKANSSGEVKIQQREPFIFRPGSSALASTSGVTGMVLSGVRTGGATVASTSANVTVWGTEVIYAPRRAGKIDGIAASGVVSGQITVGLIASAATTAAKVTARIRNQSGTWTTCLALSGTVIALGATTEVYSTYDIPYLLTTANFNAVPFGFAIGVESSLAGTATIGRIMESSYIMGEMEPGT